MNDFKNSKLAKNIKENRAVYITALTLLIALAVIITLTAVANRSKKPVDTNPPVTDPITRPSDTTDKNQPSAEVVEKLPEFTLPVSGKLAKAHDSEVQVFSNTMQDYRVHLGLDICAAENTPVSAVAEGTVVEVWEDELMGCCVAVSHAGDAVSVYKNLNSTLPDGIVSGVKVKAGDTIGYIGDTAMLELADEPHLHFEMTVAGIQVNPLDYFGDDSVATLAQDDSYEASDVE